MKRSVLFVAVMSVLLSALPAFAHGAGDADDVDGFLDIARVNFNGVPHGYNTVTVKTHEGFACNYLKPSYANYFKVYWDNHSNGSVDLVGKAYCADNKLYMTLHGPQTGSNYEPIRLVRPRAKVTKIKFPYDLNEVDANHVSVKVKTKDGENINCKPTACKDNFPDAGWFSLY